MMKRLLAVLGIAALLTACTTEPTITDPGVTDSRITTNFDTHGSVLRGLWHGVIKAGPASSTDYTGQTLSLNFSPTYVDDTQYTLSGTGTLSTAALGTAALGTQALNISGKVFAGTYKYIRAQTSPPPPPVAQLTFSRAGQADLSALCIQTWLSTSSPTAEQYAWDCTWNGADGVSFQLVR